MYLLQVGVNVPQNCILYILSHFLNTCRVVFLLCWQVHLFGHSLGHTDSCHPPRLCDTYDTTVAVGEIVMKMTVATYHNLPLIFRSLWQVTNEHNLRSIASFIQKLGHLRGLSTSRLSTYDNTRIFSDRLHDDLLL